MRMARLSKQSPFADNRTMVRPSQLLHPQREPATPRPAATVLLLRDAPEGFEVLMTRRSATASCAPLWTSCPRAGFVKGSDTRYREQEMAYGELALGSPDGQLVHHLDWRSDQPEPLLKNVTWVTVLNPGELLGLGSFC